MDLEGSQKSLDSVCKRNGTLDKEKQDAIQRCGQLQVMCVCMHVYVCLCVYISVHSHIRGRWYCFHYVLSH